MYKFSLFLHQMHRNEAAGFNDIINKDLTRDSYINTMHKHMVHTGGRAVRKVTGAMSVAQDTRLTCLSVFDLSIRAQALAM